jgi:hypothetical protein
MGAFAAKPPISQNRCKKFPLRRYLSMDVSPNVLSPGAPSPGASNDARPTA